VLMITHDLGVMSSIADWLTVMYAGRVVESGRTRDVLGHPRHPYTAGLLASLPHPEAAEDTELRSIRGAPPSPQSRPDGCPFHPRCQYAQSSCLTDVPALTSIGDGRSLACPIDPLAVAG
jgi:oligopeptide transport system ATP-binding protein